MKLKILTWFSHIVSKTLICEKAVHQHNSQGILLSIILVATIRKNMVRMLQCYNIKALLAQIVSVLETK